MEPQGPTSKTHEADPNQLPPRLNRATTDEHRRMVQSGIKSIHTTAVSNTINGYEPNKVLQRIPPVISPDERRLPRSTRTNLAQLRSGYCPLLTSYMSRLDPNVKNECPLCKSQPHDTAHLFSCPQRPTTLEATSLWENPIEAAQLLNLIPDN